MIMNKKSMILAINLMVFGTLSVLPMQQLTLQEEQARRENICHLSQENVLGVAQYFEKGVFSHALIERDIVILEKDSQQAMKNKNWAEGYFYSWMIPGSVKSVVIGSGLSSLAAGVFTAVGSVLTYNVWNSSIAANGIGRIVSSSDKLQFLMKQSDYNNFVLRFIPAIPFTFVGALGLAAVAKYSSNKLSNYKNRNAAFIQEMQERYSRNLIVIAQLQQIEYDASCSQ